MKAVLTIDTRSLKRIVTPPYAENAELYIFTHTFFLEPWTPNVAS